MPGGSSTDAVKLTDDSDTLVTLRVIVCSLISRATAIVGWFIADGANDCPMASRLAHRVSSTAGESMPQATASYSSFVVS